MSLSYTWRRLGEVLPKSFVYPCACVFISKFITCCPYCVFFFFLNIMPRTMAHYQMFPKYPPKQTNQVLLRLQPPPFLRPTKLETDRWAGVWPVLKSAWPGLTGPQPLYCAYREGSGSLGATLRMGLGVVPKRVLCPHGAAELYPPSLPGSPSWPGSLCCGFLMSPFACPQKVQEPLLTGTHSLSCSALGGAAPRPQIQIPEPIPPWGSLLLGSLCKSPCGCSAAG